MTVGVLLMAYGSPGSPDDVRPYLEDIRGGRPVSDPAVDELTERYQRIGLPSPLTDVTHCQAAGLRDALGDGFAVAVGMKHWTPRIASGVRDLLEARATRIVGIAAAPHYSGISIGGYESRVRAAIDEAGATVPVRMVAAWYEQPAFVRLVANTIGEALAGWDAAATRVIFTAHSLPARILAGGDPYRDQLHASAGAIATAAGAPDWGFAFQSASATGEPWLGPDLLEAIDVVAKEGGTRVLVAPIGFVADHLEILYDVDVEAAEHATSLGVDLRRVRSPNDDPLLIEAMAAAVRSEVLR